MIGCIIAGLVVLLFAQIEIDTAPMGYEDADGFHYGQEPGE